MLTAEHTTEIRRTLVNLCTAAGEKPPCIGDAQILAFIGHKPREPAKQQGAATALADAALRDVMGRMLSLEANKLKREAEKPSRFMDRLEEFYADHAQTLERNLLPHVAAWLAAHEDQRNPAIITRTMAQEHVAESRRQIDALLSCKMNELAAKVGECVERWQAERSVEL